MTYKMDTTRLLDTSIHYFLREAISVNVEGAVGASEDNIRFKLPNERLVVTKPIYVYVDGSIAPKDSYDIYAESGEIVFSDVQNGEVTSNYNYTTISVLDSFADDLINPPFMAIDNLDDSSKPFEIGSSISLVRYNYDFHLYGSHTGERDDLVDYVRRAIAVDCPVIDFNAGFPVDFEGKLANGLKTEYHISPDLIRDIFSYPLHVGFYKESDIKTYMQFGHPKVMRNPLRSNSIIEQGRAIMKVSVESINN